MFNYVITGATGFIMSEVIRQLLDKPDTGHIYGFDNNQKSNRTVLNHPKLTYFNDDLRQPSLNLCQVLNKNIHYVIAGAAIIGGIGLFHKQPWQILRDNNLIMTTCLDAMRNSGSMLSMSRARFVYISSSMVYESTNNFPTKEEDFSLPYSSYGFSKLSGECYCRAYASESALDYVIVRPFNAYGTNEYPEAVGMAHVIPDIIKKILDGQNPLEIFGSGSQVRCYTHVSDVADGILTVARLGKPKEAYNISHPHATTVNELIDKICKAMHTSRNLRRHLEPFEFDVQKRIPDVTKAATELNWQAKYSLDDKLPETIEWLKSLGGKHV